MENNWASLHVQVNYLRGSGCRKSAKGIGQQARVEGKRRFLPAHLCPHVLEYCPSSCCMGDGVGGGWAALRSRMLSDSLRHWKYRFLGSLHSCEEGKRRELCVPLSLLGPNSVPSLEPERRMWEQEAAFLSLMLSCSISLCFSTLTNVLVPGLTLLLGYVPHLSISELTSRQVPFLVPHNKFF